jgi:hypothetical protein
LVYEGGFAMIDVCDDSDISEIVYHGVFQLAKRAQVTRFGRFKQCFYKKNSKINEGFSPRFPRASGSLPA